MHKIFPDGSISYNNLNRQIKSTWGGVEKVSKKYTLKLRSDNILTTSEFLKYFDEFPKRIEKYKLFKYKIMVPAFGTVYRNFPFHVSDWWHFGLTEDIKMYFESAKLVKEPEFTHYYSEHNMKQVVGSNTLRFSPEQYFCYSCFSKYFSDIRMENDSDWNTETMDKYHICLANNFIVLEFNQSGIYSNKYPASKKEKLFGKFYMDLYHFYRFKTEYKKYIDENYCIENDFFFDNNKLIANAYFRVWKHYYFIKSKNTKFSKKLKNIFLEYPFSLIYFSLMFIIESFSFVYKKLLLHLK